MSDPFKYAVSLRVTHPSLRPADISVEVDMTPSHSWMVGELRKTPKWTLLEGRRKESYCTYEIGGADDGELAQCLRKAVDKLGGHREFLRKLRSTGGSLMFYIFWYPNGDTGEVFDTDLLLKMADLGIELGINVYDDREAPSS
jgi:hypothetical protein